MAFDGTAERELVIPLDGALEEGGQNAGFRPMELILMGLASCTAMDVISILKKKQQRVKKFEVKVHGDRAETHPKIFTHIVIEYLLTGEHIDPPAVERAIKLSSTKYCPAQAMLIKEIPVETKYTIFEG